jgi:hypothetical protein
LLGDGLGLELDGLGLGLVGLGVGVGLFVGVLVGLVVGGLELWLAVGVGVGEVEELVGLGVGDEIVVLVGLGVGRAEALPEVLAEPDGLDELGELAGPSAESRRIAALGRLEQLPFTIGEAPPIGRATEAAKTSELDARSMKPVSAPSATSLTRRAFTGTTSSWTSEPGSSCPPWSSQYACLS